MNEKILLTKTAEQTANIFGNFDRNIAIIEKAFGVDITNRDTEKTLGDAIVVRAENEEHVHQAFLALDYLKNMAEMGTNLNEQSVEYVVSMVRSGEKLGHHQGQAHQGKDHRSEKIRGRYQEKYRGAGRWSCGHG